MQSTNFEMSLGSVDLSVPLAHPQYKQADKHNEKAGHQPLVLPQDWGQDQQVTSW